MDPVVFVARFNPSKVRLKLAGEATIDIDDTSLQPLKGSSETTHSEAGATMTTDASTPQRFV